MHLSWPESALKAWAVFRRPTCFWPKIVAARRGKPTVEQSLGGLPGEVAKDIVPVIACILAGQLEAPDHSSHSFSTLILNTTADDLAK